MDNQVESSSQNSSRQWTLRLWLNSLKLRLSRRIWRRTLDRFIRMTMNQLRIMWLLEKDPQNSSQQELMFSTNRQQDLEQMQLISRDLMLELRSKKPITESDKQS